MTNRTAFGADRRAVLTGAAGVLLATTGLRAALAQPDPATPPATPAPRPQPAHRAPVHTPLSPREADILVKALADAETHGFRRNEFVAQIARFTESGAFAGA